MPGLEDLDKAIERMENAQKKLREETQKAHEAAQALKEQRQAAQQLIKDTMLELKGLIEEQVHKELEGLGKEAEKASRQIYDKVGRQIDVLIDLSLGKHKSRRGNTSDIRPMLAEQLKQWLKETVPELAEEFGDDHG